MINNIAYLPGLGNSDHICLSFYLTCYVAYQVTACKKYNLYLADFARMRQNLEMYDWDDALDQLDINEAWDCFYNIFDNLISECIPLSKSKNCKNIYITHEAMKLKNAKIDFGDDILQQKILLIMLLLHRLEMLSGLLPGNLGNHLKNLYHRI